MRVISVNLMRHNAFTLHQSSSCRCWRRWLLVIGLAVPAAAAPDDGQWDPTLPKLLSAGAPGDPVAIANASFEVSQMAMQTTQSLGQKFLQSIGLGGSSGGASTGSVGVGRVRGPQAIEYVIRRGGLADGRAVFMGRRHAQRAQQGRRLRREHRRLRLFRFHPVRVRRRRRADSRSTRGISTTPAARCRSRRPNAVTCCSGAGRQPARRDLSRRRQDARGLRQRGQGDGEPAAHGGAAAVSRPHDRILSVA